MCTDIDIVGFEAEIHKIRESLVDGRKKELVVVSLVGMPGNGKTTLAQKIYHDPSLSFHFDIRAWCIVSQLYHKKELRHNILRQLDSNVSEMVNDDEDSIAERIAQKLKRRRYLIIIDDIWDVKAWNDLRRYLPNDYNGSRILITTRNHNVAEQTSLDSTNVHRLRLFTEHESYELLERNSGLKDYHSDIDLLQVGHQIALNCKGLPLAIVVVAGHLAKAEKNVDVWRKFLEDLSSRILNDENRPFRVLLEWSYNCLPNHLKPCFLYAGVLGALNPVKVGELKLLLIAEGLVCDNRSESLLKQAEDYVMDLISRSLLIPTRERAIGGVKEFQMHDLLKDFCLELSEEENFMHMIKYASRSESYESRDLNHDDQTDDSRQSIIWSRGYDFFGSSFGSGHRVRSLLMFPFGYNWKGDFDDAIKSMDIEHLQVLYISGRLLISNFLDKINHLTHLKYLFVGDSFSSTNMLVIVQLFRRSNVVALPDSLQQMGNLRNIHLGGGVLVRFQTESSRLENSSFPNIETLSNAFFSSPSDAEILKGMTMLRKLSYIYDFDSNDSAICHPFPNLEVLTRLQSLKILWQHPLVAKPGRYNWNFPSNLKKLTLQYFRIPWDEISNIGRKLPKLEVLKIDYLRVGEVGITWEVMVGDFPNLRYLKIRWNSEISKWLADDEESFPKLQHLHLAGLTELEEIPPCFEESVSLRLIYVYSCKTSLCNSARRIQMVQTEEFMNQEFVLDVGDHV